MPYSSNDELPSGVKNNLPAEAQNLYRGAFNGAYEGTCKDKGSERDKCASKIAWSAVGKKFHKGADGKWQPKSLVEFDFVITKAVYDKATNEMRAVATASDTLPDSYDERMSIPLFEDFLRRAESKEKPPDEFCSNYWSGGNPYLSISHYSDMNGEAVPGEVTKLYIDGKQLKAHLRYFDTELGRATFRSVCDSLYGEQKENQDKVRVSIGFLDLAHRHGEKLFTRQSLSDRCPLCAAGIGEKVYVAGLLVHLAHTRVPVNKRTDIVPELEERAMAITRKEDAASIIGEELANELDKKSKIVGKSEAEETQLVEKADEVVEPVVEETPEVEECETCGEGEKVEASVQESDTAEVVVEKQAEPGYNQPFGGAQTFEEVEQYEATMQDLQKIHDSWYIFENLMGNIMMNPTMQPKERKQAVSKCVAGFQKRLDMKAMVTLAKLENVLEPAHPLDAVLTTLKSKYDEVVKLDADPNEVLQILQEPYAVIGNTLRNLVVEAKSVPEVTKAEEKSVATSEFSVDKLAEAIGKALSENIKPLTDSINTLVAQSSAGAGVRTVQNATPQKRNLTASKSVMDQVQAKQDENPNSIRSVIRKSVGLDN